MGDFLGAVLLLGLGILTILCAARWPAVAWPLLIAFSVRLLATLYNAYVGYLPDAGADSLSFERTAWEWAQGGFLAALSEFTGPSSYFISWIVALFYSISDRSLLLAQSLSMYCGMGTVLLGWILTRELWGERAAAKAIWVLALFPTLILYSALVMREAYLWFFLLVGVLGIVYWSRGRVQSGLVLGVFGFVGATMFHGAMLLGLLGFVAVIAWRSGTLFLVRALKGYVRVGAFALVVLGIATIGTYAAGLYSVPKIGTVDRLFDAEVILTRMDSFSQGAASYPDWLVPDTVSELIVLAPIRVTYFLFAPFPWDVSSPRHLIGWFDGLLYMGMFALLWCNRRAIWENREARIVILALLPLFLAFALTIGNFGTGVRHRAKFLAVFVALAAPMIPKLVWRTRHKHVAE